MGRPVVHVACVAATFESDALLDIQALGQAPCWKRNETEG